MLSKNDDHHAWKHIALVRLASIKSENIGGLVSLLGSCLFLAGGDKAGLIVTILFVAAEVTMARAGHLRSGYSIGCAFFALGDMLAVYSQLAIGNRWFQFMLATIALVWAAGALRAPGAWLGRRLSKPGLAALADALQPIVGTILLLLRIPSFVAAIVGGSYIGALAITCWATADVLLGRLHNLSRRFGLI